MSDTGDTVSQAWDAWFNNQWDLTRCIDRAVREQSADRSDGFRVALYAAVIEHCAEVMRGFIPDVAMFTPEVGDDPS